MTNNPNRSASRQYRDAIARRRMVGYITEVNVRHIGVGVEYDVISRHYDGDAMVESTCTYYTNGYATFWGEWSGTGNDQQAMGGASSLYNEDEGKMLAAFKRKYPHATIDLS